MHLKSNLTRSQYRIWAAQKQYGDAPLFNMALCFEVGQVHVPVFEQAHRMLVQTTDTLRTVILEVGGVPQQKVLVEAPGSLELVDRSSADQSDTSLDQWLEDRVSRSFSLSDCLFDSVLIRTSTDRFIWYLNLHHLVTDAGTTALLIGRMSELYTRTSENCIESTRAFPAYSDFVSFEKKNAAGDAEHVNGDVETAARLTLYGRPGTKTDGLAGPEIGTETIRRSIILSRDVTRAIESLAQDPAARSITTDLSIYNVVAAIMTAYLRGVSGARTVTFGTPVHNRLTPVFRETAGLFMELHPLTVDIDRGETMSSLVSKVRTESTNLVRRAAVGAGGLLETKRFNAVLNFIPVMFPPFQGRPVNARWIHSGHGDPDHYFRLQVHRFDDKDRFTLEFDFNIDIVEEGQQEQAIQQFLSVLHGTVAEPNKPLASIPLLSEAERRKVLLEWNETAVAGPLETVVDLFKTRVASNPDSPAIRAGHRTLSFADLDRFSDNFANELRIAGAGPGSRIGIFMLRSVEVVIAMLAVMKARCCFVPIEPGLPERRIRFMVEDSSIHIVATTLKHRDAADLLGVRTLLVEEVTTDSFQCDFAADPPHIDDVVYVMYTSGSTGQPKGVATDHKSLSNYLTWAQREYDTERRQQFAFFTSMSVDLTLTSILVPLISGGTLVVFDPQSGDVDLSVISVFRDTQITHAKMTPTHLMMVSDHDLSLSKLEVLIVGGEDFPTHLALRVRHHLGPTAVIVNEYGPTEATVGCIAHVVDAASLETPSVPIGKPISNMRSFILNDGLQPVPIGVVGDLWVSGTGLACGYWKRPDLTDQSFVPHPFRQGERLYRTGDRAFAQPDGSFMFAGRDDTQIKVGGRRIELSEIEEALASHRSIQSCLVSTLRASGVGQQPETLCVRCGLSSHFPGSSFGSDGLCETCRRFDGYRDRVESYFRTMHDLRTILERQRGKEYDCIVLLSGGKDSTYALCRVAEMDVRILAFTLDNGYLSDQANSNIDRVCEALSIDHVYGTTESMDAIFKDSLERHGNVCNGCFKTVYTISTRFAKELGIPVIVTGLSRGQLFETRLSEELFQDAAFDDERIDLLVLDARRAYHQVDDAVSRLVSGDLFEDNTVFDHVRFVDFYRYCDVSLQDVRSFLDRKVPWIRPQDTGRSSNCTINDVGIVVHKTTRGFHNYSLPYSWDVRLGHKTRDEAVEELQDDLDMGRARDIMDDIGFDFPQKVDERVRALAAYYVVTEPVSVESLRHHLETQLPKHMIPTHWVEMEAMPTTHGGKLDRSLLPQIGSSEKRDDTFVAPRNDVERTIAEIWQQVLHEPNIGVFDDFFELGGDSLAAIQILTRVSQAFAADLDLPTVIAARTVAKLARHVQVEECL